MELTASVELLQGLAARDATGLMSRMRALGKISALEIVSSLVKLESATI